MEKRFLDAETDKKPFFVSGERLFEILTEIDDTRAKIHNYFAEHPHALQTIFTPEKIKERATQEALSYFSFDEQGHQLDIVPQALQSDEDIAIDEKNLKIALAYREANMFVRHMANAIDDATGKKIENSIDLDADLIHRIYGRLFASTAHEKGIGRSLYSFRNSTFPIEPDVTGDVFVPVPNKDVPKRMDDLFFKYNYDWYDDNAIVKATKFFLEYYRIQPKLDGNKRTALLCANFILEKNGYPSIFIGANQKQELYEAIKTGLITRDVTDLALLFAKNVSANQSKIKTDIASYRLNIREKEPGTNE